MVIQSFVFLKQLNTISQCFDFYGFHYVLIKIFLLSANNMALLAEEVCGCKAELLSGGLSGKNTKAIITHLWGREPVLIPYPRPKQK